MRFISILLVLLLFATSVYAIDPIIQAQVKRLLDDNKNLEAYDLLLENHDPDSSDPQKWFLLGIAAKRIGKADIAYLAFEKVIELDPNAPRAKLELANISYLSGSYDRARKLLLDVKSENPPDGVVQNIDRFLAVIEQNKNKGRSYHFQFSPGILFDSNVNAGPQSETVTLFGLPFILNDAAQSQDDWAYTIDAEFDHVFQISPEINWQSNINLGWKDYFKRHDYDALTLSASTGPIFQATKSILLFMPLVTDIAWYDEIDDHLYYTLGATPQLRHTASRDVKLNLMSGIYYRNYNMDDDRDSWIYSVAPGLDYRFSERLTLRSSISLNWEDANNNIYTNRNWAIKSILFYSPRKDLLATVSGSYGKSFYEARQEMFDDKRKDRRLRVGLNLRYKHEAWDTDVILAGSYTENQSNADLYQYGQTTIALCMKTYF